MHLTVALALAAVGIGGWPSSAIRTKMIALSVGAFGVYASLPIFWTLPTAFLAGAAAAPGIAAIKSIGNLSGYFGPYAIGWIKDATGGFTWGLVTIAACAAIGLAIALVLGHEAQLEAGAARRNGKEETIHADTTRFRRLRPVRRRRLSLRPGSRPRTHLREV